jgi:predicted oxidoreductase
MAISTTNIRILFTNYDIITYFLNLASCSEHFISIKHRILYMYLLVTHISGVLVSVLAPSAVDRGFEPRSRQTKDYKVGICCFSAVVAILSTVLRVSHSAKPLG